MLGMSGALLVGRTAVSLDPKNVQGGSHHLYAAQLLDDTVIEAQTFEHCTFANISFKDAKLRRCRFLNCAFVDCYFRDATLENCDLTACKLVDCNLEDPAFVDCTLKFLEFRGCYVPYDKFRHALPTDPGLRHRMADELSREATLAGDLRDARRYRLIGEDAYEDHVWNYAWASGGQYYEKHRPALFRLRMALAWIARKSNRRLWGYGEKGLTLAGSFALVGIVLFPALFFLLTRDDLVAVRGSSREKLSFWDYQLFSFDNLVNAPGFAAVEAESMGARWLVAAEVLVGLMFIGLFITLVFNWIRRR